MTPEDPTTEVSIVDTIRELAESDLKPARLLFVKWREDEIGGDEMLRGLAEHVGGVVAAVNTLRPALEDRSRRAELGISALADVLDYARDDKPLVPGVPNKSLVALLVQGAIGAYRHARGKDVQPFEIGATIPLGGE